MTSNRRRDPKRDAAEPAIVEALRAIGATVSLINGTGVPDLVVGFRGENYLLEVKSDNGSLTLPQQSWHDTWQGKAYIVRTVDEALSALGVKGSP